MDLTQRLDWDEEENPDHSSNGAGDSRETPKPVGRLHLLSSKYGPEKDFWIYPGENVIGRLESCQVYLPAASVSKTHAVIEVPSHKGPHLLYDQGSLNRTRRQRMVLIPHVRYSLQDGDAIVFGDVGCQYFMLAPEGTDESLDESVEVPPTQKIAEIGALAIEETPAPGKRMAFGGVLVQDSDKEEDEEEVVNGVGRIRHLPASDGSDSSIKDGARGCSALGSSAFFSPSATVVPESDEESEEPSGNDPPCPPLRLCLESQDGVLSPLANGVVTPPSPRGHPLKPRTTETGMNSGDSAPPSGPNLPSSHQDSDTDVEDEGKAGSASETPKSEENLRKDGWDLEVGSDTDADEPEATSPDAACLKSHQTAVDVGRDTDGERAESPGQNGDDDTDAEDGLENSSVASPSGLKPRPEKEGKGYKGAEGAQGSPDVAHPKGHEKGGSDRGGEEAGDDPDVRGRRTHQPAEEEDSDTDVEDSSLKVENPGGIPKSRKAAGDSGGETDEEMTGLVLENSDVVHSPHPSSCKPTRANVEEISITEAVLPGNSHLGKGVGDGADPAGERKKPSGAEPQRTCEATRALDAKEPLGEPAAIESTAVPPQSQYLPALSVDSDTDVEEVTENPDVGSNKDHTVTGAGHVGGCIPLEKPDGGPQKSPRTIDGEDSDTDAEVTSLSHKESVDEDSDTDAEGEAVSLPGEPLEEQDTQWVPMKSWVGGKKSAGSMVEASVGREPCSEDEDTAAEGKEPHPGEDSNTDDEPDLAFQETQCFLPVGTSSPMAAKTRDSPTAGASCGLEEVATEAFVFQSPSVPHRQQAGKESSSFLNDDDALEATQPFCQGPGQLSEDPTQSFLGEEEEDDTELILQHPSEGEALSEQETQLVVSGSAPRGQQAASLLGAITPELLSSPLAPQPVGSAAARELKEEEEAQVTHATQVPSVGSSRLSTLAKEISGNPKPKGVTAPEGGSTEIKLETQNGAADVEPEDRSSASPAAEARDSEQVGLDLTTTELVASVVVQRSANAVFPAPVKERPTRRRGRAGSADAAKAEEPVAPVARRQGLRRLRKPTQYMEEPEEGLEQPQEEGPSPSKKTKNGEQTATPRCGRARGSQRKTGAASRLQEGPPPAVDTPGPRERTRRGKRGMAATPAEEQQAQQPRTRAASRRSSSSSVSVPSPKDSGKEAKAEQPAQSTPSSGRRSRRQSTESKPAGTRSQPRRRTQGSGASGSPVPKVLFMAGTGEEGEHIVMELGGSLAESVFDCTHLVTDRIRRTVKFLCAVARGIPVVTLSWLEKSRQNSFFLAPNSFLVSDPEKEDYFQFKLSASLQKARQEGGVLQGYEIHVTPNVNLELEDMRNIVQCGGGKFLPRMPRAYRDKRVIISCPEDLPRCKAAQDAKLPIANAEFILTGILQQKLDVDAHRLDGTGTPSVATPPTRPRRKRAAAAPAAVPSTAKRRR